MLYEAAVIWPKGTPTVMACDAGDKPPPFELPEEGRAIEIKNISVKEWQAGATTGWCLRCDLRFWAQASSGTSAVLDPAQKERVRTDLSRRENVFRVNAKTLQQNRE